jgi:hypothetical protein
MVLLSKGNGFLRTDFLAAKTGDAGIGVHLGQVVTHGQSRYRALLDACATAGAPIRISLGAQERTIVVKGEERISSWKREKWN